MMILLKRAFVGSRECTLDDKRQTQKMNPIIVKGSQLSSSHCQNVVIFRPERKCKRRQEGKKECKEKKGQKECKGMESKNKKDEIIPIERERKRRQEGKKEHKVQKENRVQRIKQK